MMRLEGASLWTCWRDTRAIVFAYLLGLIVVCWDVFRHAPMPLGTLRIGIDGWRDFSLLWAGLGFGSWLLGSIALRADAISGASTSQNIKQRDSSYVWIQSAFVLSEIILLTVITMATFVSMYRSGLIFFGLRMMATGGRPEFISLSLTAFLAGCSMTLFAGMLFSTSYLAVVLARRTGGGILLAALVFALYIVFQHGVQYLPGSFHPALPNWQLNPFDILISKRNVSLRLVGAILSRIAVIGLALYAATIVSVARTRTRPAVSG